MQERPRTDTSTITRAPQHSYGSRSQLGSVLIRFIAIIGAGVLMLGLLQNSPGHFSAPALTNVVSTR